MGTLPSPKTKILSEGGGFSCRAFRRQTSSAEKGMFQSGKHEVLSAIGTAAPWLRTLVLPMPSFPRHTMLAARGAARQ